jgi:hypothetical protein
MARVAPIISFGPLHHVELVIKFSMTLESSPLFLNYSKHLG